MNKRGLIEKFMDFGKANMLFPKKEMVLLAVSGGVDSVVMTNLFKLSGLNFGIAHCNFQLRGKDSDGDAEFVKLLAAELEVPFYTESFETKIYQKENKLSLEEAARDLRYTWLEEIRKTFNYNSIATAHHLNDSIETVFINLTKGTGINGLKGIPVKNGNIIRPLMFASRNEIESFAESNKLNFRTDATNTENDFTRNKIRNQVIPVLKEINPSFEQTFANNLQHFEESSAIVQQQIDRKLKKLIIHRGTNQYIPINSLIHLDAVNTYLHNYLSPHGFNADQINQIISCFGKSGKSFYSDTNRVIVDRKYLILTSKEESVSGITIIEKETKKVNCGGIHLEFDLSKYKPGMQLNDLGKIAYFDADKIEYPLLLRRWQPGDYLYPLGLKKKKSDKPGKKKVSDLLTDLKIDLFEKEKTMVLLSGDKIIWVVGVKQDGRFCVSNSSKQLLKIKAL